MAVPSEAPLTTPVELPTVAIAVLLLDHVPPDGDELKVMVLPEHTDDGPDIALGVVFTVNDCVLEQPLPSVYVIITVPADTPVTVPVLLPTVAIPVLPDSQVPPDGDELSVEADPIHTDKVPVGTVGEVLTVTVLIAIQPPVTV